MENAHSSPQREKLVTRPLTKRLPRAILVVLLSAGLWLLIASVYGGRDENLLISFLPVILALAVLEEANTLFSAAQSVEVGPHELVLNRFGRRSTRLEIASIRRVEQRGGSVRIQMGEGENVKVPGLGEDLAAALTEHLKKIAGLKVSTSNGSRRVYSSPTYIPGPAAVKAMKTLTCSRCGRQYPSKYWFQDSRGRPEASCSPCRERSTPATELA